MPDSLPRLDRPIVLVGLMGAGKTTVGRRLAKRLGVEFVDSDSEIERAADHSIAELFEQFGEDNFRDGERRVIARLLDGPPRVIATGGGAFMDERTRSLILDRCIAVWLDADLETIVERVSRRNHRPLLKGKDVLAFLRDLAAVRNPVYAWAHIHVRSESAPHDRTVESILAALTSSEQPQ